MAKGRDSKTITLVLPEGMVKDILRRAASMGIPRSDYVKWILRNWLDSGKKASLIEQFESNGINEPSCWTGHPVPLERYVKERTRDPSPRLAGNIDKLRKALEHKNLALISGEYVNYSSALQIQCMCCGSIGERKAEFVLDLDRPTPCVTCRKK